MTFERMKWRRLSVNAKWPRWWPCPRCGGEFKLRDGSLHKGLAAASRADLSGIDSWIDAVYFTVNRFTAFLDCSGCKETVAVAGLTHSEPYEGPEGESGEDEYLSPKFIDPPPQLFDIPSQCPKTVRRKIEIAFSLYWFDAQATGNAIRSAVERLLDSFGVPRRGKSKKGKLYFLAIQDRIDRFGRKQPELASHLSAVKWIGNAGSHGEQEALTREDLNDALEILSHTLDELYVQKRKRIKALAKEIVRRKGPRKKRKKTSN